jgi:hypothetical protein
MILAQKISPEGEVLWPEGGVQVGLSAVEKPQVTTDGFGGAIIAWAQYVCEYERDLTEVQAQRIDAQGNLLWGEPKLVHAHCPVMKVVDDPEPRIIASGFAGAIITIEAFRISPLDRYIFAQKIDSQGNLKWLEGGVPMWRCGYGIGPPHSVVTDNADGGILAFFYYDKGHGRRLLRAHRVDSTGKILWPEQGVSLTTAPGGPFSMAPDGEEGVFVAWVAHEFGPLRPYIQRISAEGELMWGDRGILLNP